MCITRAVLFGVLFMGGALSIQGQSAFNPKYGLLQYRFADENSGNHFGQSFGFDMVVEDSRVLFMPGMHYQQYSIHSRSSRGNPPVDLDRNFHLISVPVSLGAWIVGDRLIKLRLYGGGHLNFIIAVDKNNQGITADNVKAFHPGVQAGSQLMIWKMTVDIRYSHDFRNVINARAESELRGWELLVGIAF